MGKREALRADNGLCASVGGWEVFVLGMSIRYFVVGERI